MSVSYLIRRDLPPNYAGKDYVVGDLHGCFDELQTLLSFVRFDKNHDRLFCVGDLIHRGNRSEDCLKLLTDTNYYGQQWFYANLGNHDVLGMQSEPSFAKWNVDVAPYASLLAKLPLIQKVGHPVFGSFYLVHAQIDEFALREQFSAADPNAQAGLPDTVFCIPDYAGGSDHADLNHTVSHQEQQAALPPFLRENGQEEVFLRLKHLLDNPHLRLPPKRYNDLVWGRSILESCLQVYHQEVLQGDFAFLQPYRRNAARLKLFCGHSVVPFALSVGHQIYCDTGACFAYDANHDEFLDYFAGWGKPFFGLTMIDVDTGCAYTCVSSSSEKVFPYRQGQVVRMEQSLYPSALQAPVQTA